MASLSPALECLAKCYVDQILAGTKTIDTISATVPEIIKNRVIELIDAV